MKSPDIPYTVGGEEGFYYTVLRELSQYPQVVWIAGESQMSWRAMVFSTYRRGELVTEILYHRRRAGEVFTRPVGEGEVADSLVPEEFRALATLILTP